MVLQIKVNDSVAEKNKAEAEKTAGVDTEAAKAGIILSQAQALTERERKSVLHWEGELTQSKQVLTEALANTEQFNLQKVQWELRMMEKSYEELSENVIRLKRENRIGDETAETQIQQYKADLIKTWQEVALKVAQTETQREEVKAIAKRLEQKDYEIIKIVCTAIISIAAVLTAQSCTMSLSVSKNNSNSTQKTEQTTTSSVDSTNINIQPKFK